MIELKFFSNENTYCKKESRILSELLKLYPNIKVSKFLEHVENSVDAFNYKIKGFPSVIIEKDGEYYDKIIGGGPLSFYTKIINEIYE